MKRHGKLTSETKVKSLLKSMASRNRRLLTKEFKGEDFGLEEDDAVAMAKFVSKELDKVYKYYKPLLSGPASP